MNLELKERLLQRWSDHFPGVDLPIVCFYSDELHDAELRDTPKKDHTCIFAQLAAVRRGRACAFNANNLGCMGAKSTLGFEPRVVTDELVDYLVNIERFHPSRAQFENYCKHTPVMPASGRYIVFKRWDSLDEQDEPEVVWMVGTPDTMAGLHGLAAYVSMTPNSVIAPFPSGCDAMFVAPRRTLAAGEPQAVLGGLDPGMRPYIKPGHLSFAAPWSKFRAMVESMDDCFLTAETWKAIKPRLANK